MPPPLAPRWRLNTISSTPSFLRDLERPIPILGALDFFQVDLVLGKDPPVESSDLRFLDDLVSRILHRGKETLPALAVERTIVSLYGRDFELNEKSNNSMGSIEWEWKRDLPGAARDFTDCLALWDGDGSIVAFDPIHPDNERRLFQQMLDHYGPRIVSCIYTQVAISDLLAGNERTAFKGQNVDFVLAFPNGRGFILEPGDHDAGATPLRQEQKDRRRDEALATQGFQTLRITNAQIGTPELLQAIDLLIQNCDGNPFLVEPSGSPEELARLNHLILLPTLIARVEHILSFFLLQRGMLSLESFQLCIVEQDLECAELALFSFFHRLRRLSALYDIPCPAPQIDVVIVRRGSFSCAELTPLRASLKEYGCSIETAEQNPDGWFDLAIDVSIKSNHLTPSENITATCKATLRNTFPHSRLHRFSYSSLPRAAHLVNDGEELVTSFLEDFFRKTQLRDGQMPIIRNILSQKATIGLLPTSAGKSICYQLASLLTPGITFVVDPIVFLMKDQVLGLSEQYGITKVAAWHSEGGITRDDQIGELMSTNIMVFMSPERFLRPTFRSAMIGLLAGDLYVNYAVIDEAHCVSMWGHDFRPPYLMLERCFRDYCSLRGRAPVVVALTGTASQLVLIDLKRELQIEEFDAIVRPKSFDRDELTYNVISCVSGNKRETLNTLLETIAQRLGVQNVVADAYGVLFAHYPKQVWELYGKLAGSANKHITQIASGENSNEEITFGLACGGMPKDTPIGDDVWKEYKSRILPLFKRGRVRMLIGNAAIGVGIDNEYLNYVVAYCTPNSLESLGQQWGRAGRRSQQSQCYLIFSDDQPDTTDKWLNGEISQMPRRFDDLGTISFFHSQSFPGEEVDIKGTLKVISQLYHAEKDADGRRSIKEGTNKRCQHYLSFLIMMGLVEDFEVTGIYSTTQYHAKLHPVVEEGVLLNNENKIRDHLVKSLQDYLSRYRPITEGEVAADLDKRPEERLSHKTVGYLVNFIYAQIAYQRKESIRTIVTFCRDDDLSPEAIRRRMRAFFDRHPKFSDRLDAIADGETDIKAANDIVQLIEGNNDAEHLYWETRRLLDERFRADWAAINLSAMIYREKNLSASSHFLFEQLVNELRERVSTDMQQTFLSGFFENLKVIDSYLNESVWEILISGFFDTLYLHHKLDYLPVLDALRCEPEVKERIGAPIAVKQIGELLHVVESQHGLG